MERQVSTELSKAAGAGIKYVLKEYGAGKIVKVLAKASLVGLAGIAAYELTKKLRTLRLKTWDEIRYEAANESRRARQAAALKAGYDIDAPPGTPGAVPASFNADFTKYFKERMQLIDLLSSAAAKPPTDWANLVFDDDL